MKYSNEAALDEILRRRDVLLRERRRRTLTATSCAAAALLIALLGAALPLGGARAPAESGGTLGAFLLSAEAGGYVLAAVIAFTLGAAFSAACIGKRKWQENARDKTGSRLQTTIQKDEEKLI